MHSELGAGPQAAQIGPVLLAVITGAMAGPDQSSRAATQGPFTPPLCPEGIALI